MGSQDFDAKSRRSEGKTEGKKDLKEVKRSGSRQSFALMTNNRTRRPRFDRSRSRPGPTKSLRLFLAKVVAQTENGHTTLHIPDSVEHSV